MTTKGGGRGGGGQQQASGDWWTKSERDNFRTFRHCAMWIVFQLKNIHAHFTEARSNMYVIRTLCCSETVTQAAFNVHATGNYHSPLYFTWYLKPNSHFSFLFLYTKHLAWWTQRLMADYRNKTKWKIHF